MDRQHALRLLRAYHHDGDLAARERLITELLPFVRHLARRLCPPSASLEDLTQVACLALVKAVDRFDLDRHDDLFKYLVPTVIGEMKRYHRENGWTVRVPRSLQERSMHVRNVIAELATELGRSPSPRDVAERLGVTREEVVEAFDVARAAAGSSSLDEPAEDGEQGDTVGALVGAVDEGFRRAEERALLGTVLESLDDRDKLIIELRFVEELTQAQIGSVIGVSQMQVSRLLRAALERLHEAAEIPGNVPAAA